MCGQLLESDAFCPQCHQYSAKALVGLLQHKDAAIRQQAASHLIHVERSAEVITALAASLNDADADVRLTAGVTLFCFGKDVKPVISAIVTCLDHDDLRIRRVVAACLSNIGPEAREAVPKLLEMADSQDDKLRAWVAEALTKIGVAPRT
jgi:HEAT repeat protein